MMEEGWRHKWEIEGWRHEQYEDACSGVQV